MKKFLALIMAVLLVVAMCGCSKSEYENLTIMEGVTLGKAETYAVAFRKGSDMVQKVEEITESLFEENTMRQLAGAYGLVDCLPNSYFKSLSYNATGESDWGYIQDKGTLIIGVTSFKPMDYLNSNSKWIGFDADYAREVCKELGVTPVFKEIVWSTKELALEQKTIDCIWNGMTVTDAIRENAEVTSAYMINYQVVVVKDSKLVDLDSLNGKTVAVEAGSAGATAAATIAGVKIKEVESMADALLQVESGAADACVIDSVMAESMVVAH